MKASKLGLPHLVMAAGFVAVAYGIYSVTQKSEPKKSDPKNPVLPPFTGDKRRGNIYYDVIIEPAPLLSGPGAKYPPIAEPNVMHKGHVATSTGFVADDPDTKNVIGIGGILGKKLQTYAEIITIDGGTAWANLAYLAPHNP